MQIINQTAHLLSPPSHSWRRFCPSSFGTILQESPWIWLRLLPSCCWTNPLLACRSRLKAYTKRVKCVWVFRHVFKLTHTKIIHLPQIFNILPKCFRIFVFVNFMKCDDIREFEFFTFKIYRSEKLVCQTDISRLNQSEKICEQPSSAFLSLASQNLNVITRLF